MAVPQQDFIRIVAALKVMNSKYQDPDGNLQRLMTHLEDGTVRIFIVEDLDGAGNHHLLDRGDLYIDSDVSEHGPFAEALTVYAEYQHDPNAHPNNYPGDTQDAQDAFARVRRNAVPAAELNQYIRDLHHGDTNNEF
ncbi:MAG: hypothetical protein NXI04_29520 [Planctomycetaceae bacterium]|nr:hypothetical protein [Planctomycetaceae bacterium]